MDGRGLTVALRLGLLLLGLLLLGLLRLWLLRLFSEAHLYEEGRIIEVEIESLAIASQLVQIQAEQDITAPRFLVLLHLL